MLLNDVNEISLPKRLIIRQLTKWDERIESQIFLPNNKEYTITVGNAINVTIYNYKEVNASVALKLKKFIIWIK